MIRRAFLLVCLLLAAAGVARAGEHPAAGKLDAALWARAQSAVATRVPTRAQSRVIVRTVNGGPATGLIAAAGGRAGRFFPWLGGQVAMVPDAQLEWLASQPDVSGVSLDRTVQGTLERTAAQV